MLRIGIDGFNLAMPHGTGVATYAYMLASILKDRGNTVDGVFGLDAGRTPEVREAQFFDRLAHPTPEPRNRLKRKIATVKTWCGPRAEDVEIIGRVEAQAFATRLPAFSRIVTSPFLFERAQRLFAATGRFTMLRMVDPPPIMHWTYPVPVRLAGARNLYTIHDLVPLRLPYTTTDAKQLHHRLIQACIRNADQIVTVSETSSQDLRDLFGLSPDRITNTYQVSPFHAAEQAADTSEQDVGHLFGLKKDAYFLFYGSIEPKKNIGRLIEAYLSTGSDTPLVLVGSRAWHSYDELVLLPRDEKDPRHADFARRVIRLDFLPRHLLTLLIRSARAVTFPSLYEGFGLPAHEAMLLGTPVLAGRAGALPEVVGDGAMLVDPYDVGAIAAALHRLDTDPSLRDELRARGTTRARFFSPQRYGDALESLYVEILSR